MNCFTCGEKIDNFGECPNCKADQSEAAREGAKQDFLNDLFRRPKQKRSDDPFKRFSLQKEGKE